MVKLFAHRGYIENNIQQNSIASLNNAVKNHFKAIEFDIWEINNDLILSHDNPNSLQNHNLAHFKDYLIYGNQLEYWLDFKNLDLNNLKVVLNILNKEFLAKKINLNQIFFAPFITDYSLVKKISLEFNNFFNQKVKMVAVCDDSKNINQIIDLINLDIVSHISIFFELINPALITEINPHKILAWTVNDIKIMKNLLKLGVNKFATDTILPKNILP